ncbi:class I SAM-dependent methyltransferase [Winogradskyella luteola]|uniref:Methyltransferase domain-containing protein n=1 Tax=Winogradskyella luteola TaxID=2828330 RepID=A0A9X1F709_9FLAO|nr:class I SAM-dependent methyltransferase [Winogradskyella luteola]MBV7268542.1 hypothetical protein [Winogradskyella luteola]
MRGTSDKNRWSKKKSLFESWDERTQLLANEVQPNSRVIEFGAARLVLEKMLPEGCTYYNSDIVKRDNSTIVLDLNIELPVIESVDYVIFSGVLEYIYKVERLLKHLSSYTDCIVFSYATTDMFPDNKVRHYNGWVSDLSLEQIKSIGTDLGWYCEIIGTWKNQTLFKFSKGL